MAITYLSPHFAPLTLLYFLLMSSPNPVPAFNVTSLLSSSVDLSQFCSLLTNSIAADLSARSSLTLLAVPNPYLSAISDLTGRLSPTSLADVLRYHVLLEYFSWSDLRQISPSGKLVTTLYQTTGRATSDFGSVNITRDPRTGIVSIRPLGSYSSGNATVLRLVKNLPYNVSIFAVDSLLVPYGFDLMASEARPPLGLNITKALIDANNFNVAASMLAASGVVQEFEADEGGAGITLFVPTDDAFSNLPETVKLQSLPAEQKAVVLKFHVLHSYYPLGSLESIVNPVQPTLATEDMGAGRYTLNISKVNGSVGINTGIVQATVSRTVFDQNPVAIFGVSEVLLPREIFGDNPTVTTKPSKEIIGAPPPDSAPPPGSSAESNDPPLGLSSPGGVWEEIGSGAGVKGLRNFFLCCLSIGVYIMNQNSSPQMETFARELRSIGW